MEMHLSKELVAIAHAVVISYNFIIDYAHGA